MEKMPLSEFVSLIYNNFRMKTYIFGSTHAFTESIKRELIKIKQLEVVSVTAEAISSEELAEKANDSEILLIGSAGVKNLSKNAIQELKKLKFVSVFGAGTDFIDLVELKKRKIVVSNLKGVNAEAVAEHCFGMILDIAKRITEADRGIRVKGGYRYSEYEGKEIYGKTLGIIGTGDIGQKVARIASGFSMHVLGNNKSKRDIGKIKFVELDELLRKSDVVAVTVPLTTESENLLSDKEFQLMRQGVILVSTSREMIINKKAVLNALESGKLYGFGFDADIMTPIEKNDPYLRNDRIVVTPHTAFNTKESNENYINMSVENVKAFLEGKPIRVVE